MEILSQIDIDKILEAIENQSFVMSIIEIRPSEIDEITDITEKAEWKKRFDNANYLYVYPLEKLLKYISNLHSKTYYKQNFGDTSILHRITSLKTTLLRMGYSSSQLTNLVPQSSEEIEILVKAKNLGFEDKYVVNNTYRVMLANNYLKMLENEEEQSRKIA